LRQRGLYEVIDAEMLAEVLAEMRSQELRRRRPWQQLLSNVCYSKSYVVRGVWPY
jgi:hypothetical protein